jgi:hypothetical protein
MSFLVRIHQREHQLIAAVIDKELLGKLIQENDVQLDLRSDFYKGKEMNEQAARKIMRAASQLNLAGQHAVQIGIEEGLVDPAHVLLVGGVPHAQVVVDRD